MCLKRYTTTAVQDACSRSCKAASHGGPHASSVMYVTHLVQTG